MKNISYSRAVFFVLTLYFALSSAPALADIKNLDEAISIAGKQRTLTQQILKNYSLIAMKVRERKAKQELAQATALFDVQLSDLKKFSNDTVTQQQLAAINQLWQEVKDISATNVDNALLLKLNSKTDTLLNAGEQLVSMLLKGSTNGKGALLNSANTEQMLLERIVALYALKTAGIVAPYQDGYNKAASEFEQNLDSLQSSSNNSIKLTTQLTRIKKHFKRFNTTVTTSTSGNYSVAIVSAAAERITLEMAEIILGYQQLKLD